MFVVFEGIDGSGKTTISNRVADELRSRGLSVTHLRAGGKLASQVSEAIRELGRDARHLELVPQAEFLLYLARDVQLMEQVLRPAAVQNDVVITDRFFYTAETLARFGRNLPSEWITAIISTLTRDVEPDLVVLMDVDPTLARARRKSEKLRAGEQRPPSRKGLAGVGLQHRLRSGYMKLAESAPERWVVVDNEQELERSVTQVAEVVEEAIRNGASQAIEAFRARQRFRFRDTTGLRVPRDPADALESLLERIDRVLQTEPQVAAYLMGGLCGSGVDERRRRLAANLPQAVLAAATGMLDELSWELRERFRKEHPRAVAATLSRIPNQNARASRLRAELASTAPREVLLSTGGLDDAQSWELRERLLDGDARAVIGSLKWLGSERAWRLRARWLEEQQAALATSYELAALAARSVTGLGDERAFVVRERARPAAPVAALLSLEGLTSSASWAYRDAYLASAPKAVMATLRGLCEPAAWSMRRRVVAHCKEALDSIVGLDGSDAWQLREDYADTWPSTVVKTLGALADEPRGRTLIERQLRLYPNNLSLLKHAAAVALGVHRSERSATSNVAKTG